MGDFQSGRWVLTLSIYFFLYFLILFAIINISIANNVSTDGIRADDPGFGVDSLNDTYIGGAASSDVSLNPVKETFSFMFGFQSKVFINIGGELQFALNFWLTYIPLFLLGFSVYMMLPFAH